MDGATSNTVHMDERVCTLRFRKFSLSTLMGYDTAWTDRRFKGKRRRELDRRNRSTMVGLIMCLLFSTLVCVGTGGLVSESTDVVCLWSHQRTRGNPAQPNR